jgi:2'-5' RNA ligase
MADLDRARALEFGSMTVRSLTFFQSVLKPSGAEYHPLAVFNLP